VLEVHGTADAVELWTVTGGGHTWPGGPQYLPVALVGRASDSFSASDAIWSFFAAHG
jgi:polyhydroxybutyrate depolymerase